MSSKKKKCSDCKQEKPLSAFGVKEGVLGGHHQCMECRRERFANYRLEALKIIANGKKIQCIKHKEWSCCGDSTNLYFLSFDHINGDGAEHRRELGGNSYLYRWIIKNPKEARERIQIICMNAQKIKAKLNGEVHRRKERVISKEERKRQMNKDVQQYAL